MTKGFASGFGEPLSEEGKRYVNEVRLKLTQPIHPTFDTDFNIYRFVLSSERIHKKEKDIIEHAAKAVNNHLRIRKSLNLDTDVPRAFDENPIFQKRLMPKGEIQEQSDSYNRLLWFIEYASITVESIAHSIRSSEACKYQFWQFEYMLRRVMKQEEKTGKLSSLRHVIDMHGYEINPFTMLFVSSGTLAYYSQLFHYENYPELVSPVEIVNIAKWIHVPYKLAKTMMPSGFADKFRLHDNHFLKTLKEEIRLEDIPESLGGVNKTIKCVPAVKVEHTDYWQPDQNEIINDLESVHVGARKNKHITVEINEPKEIKWYFRTDGDVYFGIFYEDPDKKVQEEKDGFDHEKFEMVYPWLKLSAKLVHERDSFRCTVPGKYHIVFCNKHSWLSRRNVDLFVQIVDAENNKKRLHSDGTLAQSTVDINVQ
ncbi:unnamed protein product [Auanema sp. JU1783]|nr:unnamed protein product [Auanema sp. JU1783]